MIWLVARRRPCTLVMSRSTRRAATPSSDIVMTGGCSSCTRGDRSSRETRRRARMSTHASAGYGIYWAIQWIRRAVLMTPVRPCAGAENRSRARCWSSPHGGAYRSDARSSSAHPPRTEPWLPASGRATSPRRAFSPDRGRRRQNSYIRPGTISASLMRFTRRTFALLGFLATPIALAASAQTVQYRSPAGIEHRAQSDTGPVARAQAASAADSGNVDLLIRLGIAQSGARQFREAIHTFSRGLAIAPDNAILYRWRGHRYLSIREHGRAEADFKRGLALDSANYGIWYHLGVLRFLRGDF